MRAEKPAWALERPIGKLQGHLLCNLVALKEVRAYTVAAECNMVALQEARATHSGR
jgi:hypothetical protein